MFLQNDQQQQQQHFRALIKTCVWDLDLHGEKRAHFSHANIHKEIWNFPYIPILAMELRKRTRGSKNILLHPCMCKKKNVYSESFLELSNKTHLMIQKKKKSYQNLSCTIIMSFCTHRTSSRVKIVVDCLHCFQDSLRKKISFWITNDTQKIPS